MLVHLIKWHDSHEANDVCLLALLSHWMPLKWVRGQALFCSVGYNF